MTVIFWLFVIFVFLYLRAHSVGIPYVPPRRTQKGPHKCEFHIDGCSYEIYPDDGQTIESTMRLHRSIMAARARAEEERLRLEEKKRTDWGHAFDPKIQSCLNCGISPQDFYRTLEPAREACNG